MNSRTQARREPLPDETTLGKAAYRRKAIPNDGLAISGNIGDHRYHARGQPARR